ncbi:FliH/SctL family protein [Clostridium sardiniense]|uniref:FliH/SctL family protein n=1 Tax=Clostridium sardiniense TaxID=29369 RepID=UPI003D330F9E
MSRFVSILSSRNVQLKGKVTLKESQEGGFLSVEEKQILEKEDIENKILEAKRQYEKVIIETEYKKESLIKEANERAKDIEKKAYKSGYDQGLKNGYEDGYKESYEKNIEKAISESEKIKEEGYKTLFEIREKIAKYIKENRSEILNISIKIAEQVLKEKFEERDSMNNMLIKIIGEYNLKKDLIIKVNPNYSEQLETSIDKMINEVKSNQKIFVIPDSSIEKGNAEIDIGNGKLTVGLDVVLDRVKSELL